MVAGPVPHSEWTFRCPGRQPPPTPHPRAHTVDKTAFFALKDLGTGNCLPVKYIVVSTTMEIYSLGWKYMLHPAHVARAGEGCPPQALFPHIPMWKPHLGPTGVLDCFFLDIGTVTHPSGFCTTCANPLSFPLLSLTWRGGGGMSQPPPKAGARPGADSPSLCYSDQQCDICFSLLSF